MNFILTILAYGFVFYSIYYSINYILYSIQSKAEQYNRRNLYDD